MRLLVLFMLTFSTSACFGQSSTDLLKMNNTTNEIKTDKMVLTPKIGKERYKPSDIKYDYLEPSYSDFSILFAPTEYQMNIDTFFQYKNGCQSN